MVPGAASLGARLGHSCTLVAGDRCVWFGGASPAQAFGDVHQLDLGSFGWTAVATHGDAPPARYDHCAAAVADGSVLVVVGGAEEAGNLADVHALDLGTLAWRRVPATGTAPSARTMHMDAMLGNRLFVFGGGHQGPEPVDDVATYALEMPAGEWRRVATSGPAARQGHSLTAVDGRLLVLFGGMAGAQFLDDLWVFDPATSAWKRQLPKGPAPRARSGHAACAVGTKLYVHGGLAVVSGVPAALDDLWVLDVAKMAWRPVELACAPIPGRLDHTLTAVTVTVGTDAKGGDSDASAATSAATSAAATSAASAAATSADAGVSIADITAQLAATAGPSASAPVAPAASGSRVPALLLYGGVDVAGNTYDDCLLLRPE